MSLESDMETNEMMRTQQRDMNSYALADAQRSPNGGYTSDNDANKTRTAVIGDPFAKGNGNYNELDPIGAYNPNTGGCAIKYENTPGGFKVKDRAGETKWKRTAGGSSSESSGLRKSGGGQTINPEERTSTGYATNSSQEVIQAPKGPMWTGGENWCGLNWQPPTGTRVTTTQGQNGIPQIAGTAPADVSKCKPVLNMGEVCLKGYGNAYVMCRQSDKVDIVAGCSAGNYDLDDPNGGKTNASDCSQMIRLDANGGNLLIRCTGGGGSSAISMTGTEITITSTTIRLQADMIYEN